MQNCLHKITFSIWDWLFVYTLLRYWVPLVLGLLLNPIPETFFIELDWNFVPDPGLLINLLPLTFVIDWFWLIDWLFTLRVVPVETNLVRYFELPLNIFSICYILFDYCFWLNSSNNSPHPTLSSSLYANVLFKNYIAFPDKLLLLRFKICPIGIVFIPLNNYG